MRFAWGLWSCVRRRVVRPFVRSRAHAGLWIALSLIPLCSVGAFAGAPAVTFSPTSLSFPTQLRGTTSPPQTVTLTNTGTASLTISSVRASAYYGQTNNCPASLAAGASCSISVTFSPAANGTIAGTVSVVDNAAGTPQSVTLSGICTVVSLSPASLTFPNEPAGTSSPSQPITLSNVGANSVHVSAITFQGASPTDFSQTNNCAAVAPGATCTINVVFTPASAGSFTANVNVAFTGSVSPVPATLSGTGLGRSAAIPFLQQPLAPMTALPGGSGSTLTLNGSGFVAGSSVLWNGTSRATTFISATQLQAAILSTDVASAGTAQVSVTSPAPGGGVSNAQSFQITSPTNTIWLGQNVLSVGSDPRGIVIADFNGDGKPDMAIVNRGSDSISILLGNGDGTFAPAVTYATGADCIAIAVGDLNGDGKMDLVTANRAAYTISVLLGNGDGTFGSHTDYTVGTEPMAVALGDFNGDGFLDVAEVNNADNTLSILLGVGNGALQNPVTYSVGSSPIAIVTGDFNGDGYLDLATANTGGNNVSVLFGNGNGTFQAAAFYATGDDPDGMLAADLNGDGKLDLVVADNGSDSVSVLLNAGNGTFASNVVYPVGTLPFAVAAGDFVGNGKIDIAVVNSGDDTVSIVPGNGDGTLNPAGTLTFATGNNDLALATGDFNHDGRADLVVSNSQDNTISVMLQVPGVSLSTASLAFGAANVGAVSGPLSVVLTNAGSAALTIGSVAVSGASSSQFSQTNNCPLSPAAIAPQANCTITVTFAPTVTGTASANLTITDGALSSPQTVALLGTGIASVVGLSPASLTFPSQVVSTTSAPQAVMVTNSGSEALALTSITASAGYAQTNNCGTSLAAGAACTINVTFTPTATGTVTGTVTLVDSAAGGSQTVSLSGIGAAAPTVTRGAHIAHFYQPGRRYLERIAEGYAHQYWRGTAHHYQHCYDGRLF